MPAKKIAKTTGRQLRKRPVSLSEIKEMAEQLRAYVETLDAAVELIQRKRIATLEIDGVGLVARGVQLVGRYAANVSGGINDPTVAKTYEPEKKGA